MSQGSVLGTFRLADEIQKYDPFDPADSASLRRSETLIKTDRLRVVLISMLEGAELQEHHAPGPITIQALAGAFVVSVDGREIELPAGDIVSIEAQAPHAVRATEKGAFLLTIAWSPDFSGKHPAAS